MCGDGSRDQSRRLRGHRFRCNPLLAGFLLAWRQKTPYAKDNDFVFPSTRLKGRKPLSASILVQKYLRPAAVKAGVIEDGQKVPRVPQLPSFAGFGPGEDESRPEDRPGVPAAGAHQDYSPAVRPIRHGVEAGRAGQVPGAVAGRQGTPANGANSVIILGGILGGRFRLCAAKFFGMMVARDGIEPPTPAFSGLE